MDRNNGRASPLPGRDLIAAVKRALVDYPDAEFEGNKLGNLAVTVDDEFVGWIDVRANGPMPVEERWNG